MTIETTQATSAEEIEAARRLLLEYADSLGWDRESAPWFCEEVSSLPGPYAPPRGSLLLALVDGEPAAVVGLQPVPERVRIPGAGAERFGELKRLFVRPAFRRCGVGQEIMRRAEAEARERGYEALVLTTAAEYFPDAPPLYDKLGYVETDPYRDDMLFPHVMWRRKDL